MGCPCQVLMRPVCSLLSCVGGLHASLYEGLIYDDCMKGREYRIKEGTSLLRSGINVSTSLLPINPPQASKQARSNNKQASTSPILVVIFWVIAKLCRPQFRWFAPPQVAFPNPEFEPSTQQWRPRVQAPSQEVLSQIWAILSADALPPAAAANPWCSVTTAQ